MQPDRKTIPAIQPSSEPDAWGSRRERMLIRSGGVQKVRRAPMGCTNQQPVRTQGQNAGRAWVRQGISGVSALDWRNLHWAGGWDRWLAGDGHWMWGDGGVWGGTGSREARYGRGQYESGTMHRAALMCTFSRFISAFPCFTSTFPRSGPIHASGFPAASRMITIPIVFIRPHEPGMKSSPIPAFPLRGRGATFRTIDRDRRCPVPRLFSNSPSSLLG
jgi:hypothetical protein